MLNTSKSLIVQGQAVAVTELLSPRAFIAASFGITLPKVAKGGKGISMKDLKAQIVAEGVAGGKTEADMTLAIKEQNKAYDALRNAHYRNSALITGQLAADPTVRKALRVSVNRKGEVIGAVTTFRREKVASGANALITQLQQQVAALTAQLGGAALPVA